jgi:sterol desaturase/sphingolipid hydroxylase (fatty acid hydroxylase superfamily)
MAIDTFLAKIADTVLDPFRSWERILAALSGIPRALTDFRSKTAWMYLLTSAVIACILYCVRKRRRQIKPDVSLRRFLFPPEVYLQRSAVVDYKYVAIDLTINSLIYTPFMSGIAWLLYKSLHPLATRVFTLQLPVMDPLTGGIVLTVVTVAGADFGFFLSHYLMHRVSILWHFHEVHHSAEVLTPVTVYRVHPVEDLINGCVAAVLSAMGASAFTAIRGSDVSIITIYGTNIVVFVFFFVAFQLRHSHVWLSYGPVLERLFISPAQHQIHHSTDRKHWNKNYGFIFATWDMLFGSLYVPRHRETLQYGVPGANPQDFATVAKLYFLPFAKAARTLLRRPQAEQTAERTPA